MTQEDYELERHRLLTRLRQLESEYHYGDYHAAIEADDIQSAIAKMEYDYEREAISRLSDDELVRYSIECINKNELYKHRLCLQEQAKRDELKYNK